MPGLEAFARGHCGASLGHHCTTWTSKLTRACVRLQSPHIRFAKEAKTAVAYSKRHLTISKWHCRASFEEDATAKEPVLPAIKEPEAMPDEVAVEEGRTVQVKFVLQKECRFGQRFNVVGNHPLFGNWDPSAAIPMDWAGGHIWSVGVDFPVGKKIEFKFVLSGNGEEIEWQPGPNRIFETVEDVSPLIVNESWNYDDNASSVEPTQESELLKEDIPPISPAELSAVAGIVVLNEAANKELVDEAEPEIGGMDVQAPSSDSGSVESSESASEVPLAETNLAATVVEVIIDGGNPA